MAESVAPLGSIILYRASAETASRIIMYGVREGAIMRMIYFDRLYHSNTGVNDAGARANRF